MRNREKERLRRLLSNYIHDRKQLSQCIREMDEQFSLSTKRTTAEEIIIVSTRGAKTK